MKTELKSENARLFRALWHESSRVSKLTSDLEIARKESDDAWSTLFKIIRSLEKNKVSRDSNIIELRAEIATLKAME